MPGSTIDTNWWVKTGQRMLSITFPKTASEYLKHALHETAKFNLCLPNLFQLREQMAVTFYSPYCTIKSTRGCGFVHGTFFSSKKKKRSTNKRNLKRLMMKSLLGVPWSLFTRNSLVQNYGEDYAAVLRLHVGIILWEKKKKGVLRIQSGVIPRMWHSLWNKSVILIGKSLRK